MSTKVEVFTSPGWEAEVDTDWAEGLFAVFLRSAKGGKRARTFGKNEQSDGVILLTVRKDGGVEVTEASGGAVTEPDVTPTTPASETRRTRRPRRPDEGTRKLQESPEGAGKGGTGRRSRHAPPPAPPPSSPRRPIPPPPPPPPPRVPPGAAVAPPARPARSTAVPAATRRDETVRDSAPPDMRVTVPAALKSTPLDDEGLRAFLFEMGALVKYGHSSQVRTEFDKRLPTHAEDPRFRRLAIDFYFEHGMTADAIDALFGLASLYFDRHDMPRMRECLDEILRHEPGSRRARKMRELLEKRPGRSRAPSSGGR